MSPESSLNSRRPVLPLNTPRKYAKLYASFIFATLLESVGTHVKPAIFELLLHVKLRDYKVVNFDPEAPDCVYDC